jgi:hypothetical protein
VEPKGAYVGNALLQEGVTLHKALAKFIIIIIIISNINVS